jgi:hypothetical protein
MKSAITLLFLLVSSFFGFTQQAKPGYQIVDDMALYRVEYETDDNIFVPAGEQDLHKKHFLIPLKRFSKMRLWMMVPGRSSLLIDGQFIEYYPSNNKVTLNIDSLYLALERDTLGLTLYHESDGLADFEGYIINPGIKEASKYDFFEVQKRSENEVRNYFLIMLILMVTIFSIIYKAYPRTFNAMFRRVLAIRVLSGEEITKSTSLTAAQWYMVLMHSAVLSFLIMLLYQNGILRINLLWIQGWQAIWQWMALTVFVLIFYMIKYLLIQYISVLFDIRQAIRLFFYEYFRLAFLFFGLLFSLLIVFYVAEWNAFYTIIQISAAVVVAFFIFRFIFLYLKLRNYTSFKNLHLFSYLCSTEIIPSLIVIKYFFF